MNGRRPGSHHHFGERGVFHHALHARCSASSITAGKEFSVSVTGVCLPLRSLRALLEQAGYEVIEERGVPAPFPLALGTNRWSRALLFVNQALIKVAKNLFAYQIFLRARPLPDAKHLLKETIAGSAALREELLGQVA